MSRGQSQDDAQLDAEPVVCWDVPDELIDADVPPAPTSFELEFDPDAAVEWLLRKGPDADTARALFELDPSDMTEAGLLGAPRLPPKSMVAAFEAVKLKFLAALPDPTLEVGVWSSDSPAVAKQDWIRESVSTTLGMSPGSAAVQLSLGPGFEWASRRDRSGVVEG